MTSWDKELPKLLAAEREQQDKTHGFQGCKTCDFRGLYCYTYSDEGQCDDCQFKTYPERWHGCLCCTRAIRYMAFCGDCADGIREWLSELFAPICPSNLDGGKRIAIFTLTTSAYVSEQDSKQYLERWKQVAWISFRCENMDETGCQIF